ncbi:hypothetical protein Glove_441g84 [Diversispora epigaea]|uniref:Galactose oxidase n=1 Tax=Diversispora epigaea TaxID=1348612 RepID=A0A397GZM4_9GLOM|nr:hypothetical protein Glove_441g84 [Diversispora epigaea]
MYLSFKLFKFLFCTLLLINSTLCYDPSQRRLHNSVIIEDRLLIFSGYGYADTLTYSFDLFYLDLSKSFGNDNLTWTLIPKGSVPIYTYDSTAVLSLDNSTIFLIGGFMRNKNTLDYDYSNLVYSYNYPASTWSTPVLSGDVVPPRQGMRGVIDNSGIIYMFGGTNITNLTTFEGTIHNDMNTFNTVSNTWSTLNIPGNLPSICYEYTVNILPNGIIVYIGGVESAKFTLVNMNQIKLFDTHKLEWSRMNTIGDEIDPRIYFSSVLTPDGNIIIFGGCTKNRSSVSPKLAILDTNKNPFEWSIPSNSEANSPPSVWGHTANLYYDYMIITFGFEIDTKSYSPSSQVHLYNIKSNEWVTTFSAPDNKSTTPSTDDPIITSSHEGRPLKALEIVLWIGLGATFLVSCILITKIIVRRIRQRPSIILEISGSDQKL